MWLEPPAVGKLLSEGSKPLDDLFRMVAVHYKDSAGTTNLPKTIYLFDASHFFNPSAT